MSDPIPQSFDLILTAGCNVIAAFLVVQSCFGQSIYLTLVFLEVLLQVGDLNLVAVPERLLLFEEIFG